MATGTPIPIVGPGGAPLTFGGVPLVWGYSLGPLIRRRRRATKKAEVGMTSYTAAAELLRRVADFSQRQPEWAECIVYETRPDERWNLPLVSWRVYRSWDEALVILAAAGLDSVEQELTERRLVLPTPTQLAAMKTLSGFVNDRFSRSPDVAADPVAGR